MEERFSTSLIFIAAAFFAAFALSLVRSEYFFGIISLGFSVVIYCVGFVLAKHEDSKDLSNQLEN